MIKELEYKKSVEELPLVESDGLISYRPMMYKIIPPSNEEIMAKINEIIREINKKE